jgi:hypothetical protein
LLKINWKLDEDEDAAVSCDGDIIEQARRLFVLRGRCGLVMRVQTVT